MNYLLIQKITIGNFDTRKEAEKEKEKESDLNPQGEYSILEWEE